MAHRLRKSTWSTRLGKKARAPMRWSLEANLAMLGTVAAIAITLSLLLLVLPTSELHAQANSAPSVSRVSPSSPVSLTTGGSQTFQVSASDADNNLTKWEWEVDKHDSLFDGHQEPEETFTATGSITKSFSHTFPDDGTYTVTVTFTDSDGESGTAEWRVEVEDPANRAPSVSRVSPFSFGYVATGDVTFTATATDPDDNLKSYEWFVDDISGDDGSWLLVLPTGAVTKSYTHTFSTAGEYTVKVTFTDDDGLSASASWTVTAVEQLTVQLGADNYTVTEGGGYLEAAVTVTISGTPPQTLQVGISTYDGTARKRRDFYGLLQTVTFSPSSSLTQTVPVRIINDNWVEPTEDFTVGLSSRSSTPPFVTVVTDRAAVTIEDDDEATVGFRLDLYRVLEDSLAVFCVKISDPATFSFDVHFSYSDPDGALSPGAPSSLPFPPYQIVGCFRADIGNVVETTEMTITLTGVTSTADAVSRVKLGTPATATVEITDNDIPFITPVSPSSYRVSLEAGASQTFTARATDRDNSISAYAWSVDGQEIDSGPLALTGDVTRSFTHTFPDDGTYTVWATFTDKGGESSSRSWTVVVGDSTEPANQAPSVSRVSPSSSSVSLEAGASQTFTARATDADSNITSYAWTVNGQGVGNSGSLALTGDVLQTFTHTFSSSDPHTVEVVFTDDQGATGSASWTVEVEEPPPTENRSPTVSIVSPATSTISLRVGDVQTFDVRGTDPDGNLAKWKWVVDKHDSLFDGHQEPEESFAATGRILKSFSHTFPDDGTYTVTVTFTDSEGLTGAAEWTVKVFDGPVSLICGVEPIDSSSSALVGGQLVRTFAEVTAREDLTDIYVHFRAFHPVRGLSDEARSDKEDIDKDDIAKLGVEGVFIPGDGFILECTVKDAGLFGVIDPLDKTLASRQSEPFSLGPYSVSTADRDKVRGWLRSCGPLDTLIESGSQVTFTPKITQNNRHRAIDNGHPVFRAHVNVYKDGERVWRFDTGDHQGTADLTQYDLGSKSFTPSEPGGYAYDCVLTSRKWRDNAFVSVVSKLPVCVHDPITLTLCAIVFVHELANLYQYDWSLSSTFCVGGYPDCPFTYDTGSNTSPPSVRVGEPVSLSFRTSGLNGVVDHGGVTVSFPDLTDVGTTSADHEYVSDKASVSTVSYTTGTSNVTYHRTGASVQTVGGAPGTANYLLVESDDSSWPSGADRTLELEFTPWEPGTFQVQYRYWLCLAGYDDCRRKPESGEPDQPDQQGWQVDVLEITVNAVPDRDELVEFYEDTDGPNWDDDTGWLSHVPLDDWRGVDTGADGRVTVVELPSNSLSGAIPTVVGDLTGLEVLDLSGNGLTGEIPAAIESLTALTTLNLSGNGLRGEIPSDLGDLTALTTLDLSVNGLRGEIPSDLGDLTALTTLDLSVNDLNGGIPMGLGRLIRLEALRLSDNDLNRPIPAELGNLTKLTELDLSDNGLSGSIPAELDKLADLQVLDLSGNSLSGAIPEGLGRLAKLVAVYLDGNNLDSGCIPATWRDLRNHDLDDVDLPFCDVALSALTVSPGELTPLFDPGVSEYTAQVEEDRVTITPVSAHGATFEFLDGKGKSVPDADGALGGHQIDVGSGDATTIEIRVVSQDGEESHTYTVEVVPAGEPLVPAIAAITPGASSLEVSWGMPTDIRDDYITSYDLRHIQSSASDKADSNWTMLDYVWTSGPLSHTVKGLHAGTGYDVQLRAVTSAGDSPWSATVSGTPAEGECSTGGAVSDPANNAGQAADCEVLLEVRDALSGDGDLDWESSDPISGWDGAEVDPATGRITRLDLDGAGQAGVAPSGRVGLTRQQTPGSSKAPLTGEIPATLSSLTDLEYLSLAHNQLTGGIPGEMARLTKLQALRLQGNLLTGQIPSGLAGLSNLVELKLAQNRLTGCVPEGLLDVADNDLDQLGLPTCGPAVVMSLATTSIAVRIGRPIAVTATFDEPVTGFTVGGVSVVNGSAGSFSGSDGDTVYPFAVVPDAIGAVTVDIVADAAEDPGGNGNRAAPRLWLGMPYDDDGDRAIEKSEVIEAINDYLFGEGAEAISKAEVIELINLYLFG